MVMIRRALAFSDPHCPFCYATEERLHGLGVEDRVQWCGVQHAPRLPVPMAPADRVLGPELAAEVPAIRAGAPELHVELPRGKPNTALAIRYGAAALRTAPEAGRRFVRSLYRAFWVHGRDLSDSRVLDRLADEAGLPELRPDDRAVATTLEWERTWRRTGLSGVPVLVRDDGRVLYGLVESDELHAFLCLEPAA
jgi:predicted DsbA family dithiol-disulfide isomerase